MSSSKLNLFYNLIDIARRLGVPPVLLYAIAHDSMLMTDAKADALVSAYTANDWGRLRREVLLAIRTGRTPNFVPHSKIVVAVIVGLDFTQVEMNALEFVHTLEESEEVAELRLYIQDKLNDWVVTHSRAVRRSRRSLTQAPNRAFLAVETQIQRKFLLEEVIDQLIEDGRKALNPYDAADAVVAGDSTRHVRRRLELGGPAIVPSEPAVSAEETVAQKTKQDARIRIQDDLEVQAITAVVNISHICALFRAWKEDKRALQTFPEILDRFAVNQMELEQLEEYIRLHDLMLFAFTLRVNVSLSAICTLSPSLQVDVPGLPTHFTDSAQHLTVRDHLRSIKDKHAIISKYLITIARFYVTTPSYSAYFDCMGCGMPRVIKGLYQCPACSTPYREEAFMSHWKREA